MNAIRHNRIGLTTQEDGSIDVVIPASMAEDFKLLVKRGTNTYPSMHIEIRDFADRLLRPDMDTNCMKQELFGYPTYAQEAATKAAANNIVSTHWDIPSEDKMMIAEDKQSKVPVERIGIAVVTEEPVAASIHCVKCAGLKHQHPNRMCDEFTLKA